MSWKAVPRKQELHLSKETTLTAYYKPWLNRQCAAAAAAKSLQSCLTLCDPRDGSPRGSAIPGILQARTLEWVAISFSEQAVYTWANQVELFWESIGLDHKSQHTDYSPWIEPGLWNWKWNWKRITPPKAGFGMCVKMKMEKKKKVQYCS